MPRPRLRPLLLVLLFAFLNASAEARHRAVSPTVPPPSPGQWLDAHAIVLATTEAGGGVDDLAPLASIVGNASVVGLGDGTHGTHEFFSTKLRILQFLVERMGFDVLAMEGAFPQFERVNAYVQGGPGDVRTLLEFEAGTTFYYFWHVEEFAAVVEWMRNYNLTRGSKPAIEIFGADVVDGVTASHLVLDYLRTVDPAAASAAEGPYACLLSPPSNDCFNKTRTIRQQMAAKEADYTALSSARRFADALQAATVASQSLSPSDAQRDPAMATNVVWARDHRSTAKKVVYWAHAEHVTRLSSAAGPTIYPAAGESLTQMIGSGYVNFANATWSGTLLTRSRIDQKTLVTRPFSPAGSDAYENFFHASHNPAIVVPLHGDLHPFFFSPHHLREAGSVEFSAEAPNWDTVNDLVKKFDAVVFVEQTTPLHPLN